jgi:aminoglycoside/choline kinase family phosphotransferase
MMKVPTTPEELSADWLTLALRQGNAIGKALVRSFQVAPLAESKGFYGQLKRVTLEYDREEAGAPRSLIAKFSSATQAMRQQAIPSYQREVHFYRHLAQQTKLPTPNCYYADINSETGEHVLLLQDLAPAQSGSRIEGCSIEHAKLAVHHIASFHATWWQSPLLEQLEWIPREVTPDRSSLHEEYQRWWSLFYEQVKDRLPDSLKVIGERLGEQRAMLRQQLFGSSPQTLIHRDFQADNLIFGTQKGGVPFAVVDWQFLSRGRGIWDVAYFLSESMLPADRRAIEGELLASYHQSLLDQGVEGYSFEQLLYDYRLSLLQRFTALVSTIAVMPFSEEQRQLHINILLPRNGAAILDHNAGELLL